jgi:hypothetical protein
MIARNCLGIGSLGAGFLWFYLGAGEIGVTSCGGGVAYSSSCVNVDYVVETLSAADGAIFWGVGPFGYYIRYGVGDCGSDGLVVSVFGAKWPGVFCRSFHTINCVVVGVPFREEYS